MYADGHQIYRDRCEKNEQIHAQFLATKGIFGIAFDDKINMDFPS